MLISRTVIVLYSRIIREIKVYYPILNTVIGECLQLGKFKRLNENKQGINPIALSMSTLILCRIPRMSTLAY
jgi:hypothetical protein